MKKLTADSPEAKSLDLVGENIAKLKALFPELLTEGKDGAAVNVDVLKQLVGDATVTDTDEKYGLTWNGKRKARLEALKPSTGTLRPAKDDSVEWDSTQNLVIEGDNLEVLKLLQKSYANQVKLIYIDPPYNTGSDFVYPDDYQDNLRNYQERMGTLGVEQNAESSGRFHTDWLNMMLPRLKLAKDLLSADGVLVIHIDENEYANLEKLLAEVLGDTNNLGTVVWDKRNPKGEVVGIAQQHELLSVYGKDKAALGEADFLFRKKANAQAMLDKVSSLIRSNGSVGETVRGHFSEWLNSQRGKLSGGELAYNQIDDAGDIFQLVSMAAPDKPETRSHRPLIHPLTQLPCPVPTKGWRYPDKSMDDLLARGLVIFGADESVQPRRKYLLRENLFERIPSLLYFGGSGDALGVPFENPKPTKVAQSVIEPFRQDAAIILDFFAGSGTSGHAVMAQNAADGGNRRYILVQLPEPLNPEKKEQKVAAEFCDKLGKPRTIAELTKERLRRAAKKVKAENPLFHGDLGFRVFKLDTSNLKAWDPNTNTVREDLLSVAEHVKPDRSNDDLLYELLLKRGLDLAVPMEQKTIAGQVVHAIGGGVMLVCLADAIDTKAAEPLALGIAEWHKQLAPANDKETVVVFKDSAFDSNVAKSNLTEILKQRGLEKVNSI